MGTADLAERALLQGLIKVAAAYVHGVRGNPAGIARNLEGARRAPGRGRGRAGPAGHPAGIDVDALIARDRPPAGRPGRPPRRPDPRSARPAKERPDEPAAADPDRRRHRGRAAPPRGSGPADPARRPRGRTSSPRSGRRARSLVPTSSFMTRVGELPTDRPLLVICHVGGRRRPSPATCPAPAGRTWSTSPAGWTRGSGPGCRSAAVRSSQARATSRADVEASDAALSATASRPRWKTRPMSARVCALWANAQPMRISRMKVDGADAGRVQIAELLADLALDLEARDGRPDQAELEERAQRRGVGPHARRAATPSRRSSPPTMTAFGPLTTAARALEAGRAGR